MPLNRPESPIWARVHAVHQHRCRTPAAARTGHGTPFSMGLDLDLPNASVEFKEGTVNTSRLG